MCTVSTPSVSNRQLTIQSCLAVSLITRLSSHCSIEWTVIPSKEQCCKERIVITSIINYFIITIYYWLFNHYYHQHHQYHHHHRFICSVCCAITLTLFLVYLFPCSMQKAIQAIRQVLQRETKASKKGGITAYHITISEGYSPEVHLLRIQYLLKSHWDTWIKYSSRSHHMIVTHLTVTIKGLIELFCETH